MTTTWVKTEPQKGRSGSGDIRQNSASEVFKYRVYFTGSDATSYDAENASGTPAYGAALVSPIAGTIARYVSRKQATQRTDDPLQWDVDVTYSTPDPSQQPPEPSGFSSGDKYGVQVTRTPVPYETIITKDTSGNVISNTNGEPLDPPITLTTYDRQFNVQFWTDKMNQSAIDACIGKANSSSVTMTIGANTWTFPTNTFKFNNDSWTIAYNINGAARFQVTFEFIYRVATWTEVRPNMSYYLNKDAAGVALGSNADGTPKLRPIQDMNNQKMVTQPRFLTSAGAVIPPFGTIYNLSFTPIATTSFSTLLSGVP